MSLPPLTHLATRSLEGAAPTDATTDAINPINPTKDALSIDAVINRFVLEFGGVSVDATGAKRKRAETELETQTALSVDAIINRFRNEFGKALATVTAVAKAAEEPNEAQRVAAVVKVITEEVADLRAERTALYNGDPAKGPEYNSVIQNHSSLENQGHKMIQQDRDSIVNQSRLHRSGQLELTPERKAELIRRYQIYTAFISSSKWARLRDIELRLRNTPPAGARAEHAKAAIRILSGQPHDMEGGRPHTYYKTWDAAFGLFDAGLADVPIEDSNFNVAVRNNGQECGGKVVGSMWLQDIRFQRVLLQLGEEATPNEAQHSHEGKGLVMKWRLRCYEWINPSEGGAFTRPYEQDEGVRNQSFLLSVETAARRVRRWIGTQSMKSKPVKKGTPVGLLGWDVKLNLDTSDNRWARERVEAIASMGGEQKLEEMGAVFARRTARRLLLRKCTRRLARIGTAAELAEGIDGVDDSGNVQIEFGVDGASTPNVDALLALLATPPVGSTCSQTGCDPMRALYSRRIKLNTNAELTTLANTQRLAFFRNSRSKRVALVSWGWRTCVLFKHKSDETTSFKLVDPLGKYGPFPKVLTQTSWVERPAEAASGESSLLAAVTRAMAIAHAAWKQPSTNEEAVMRAALASPAEGVAPLCAAVAVLAHATSSDDKFERGEVFPIADYTMNKVREAMATRALLKERRLEAAPPAAVPAAVPAAAPAAAEAAEMHDDEGDNDEGDDDDWWDDAEAEDATVEDGSDEEDDWWDMAEEEDSFAASMAYELVLDTRSARVALE